MGVEALESTGKREHYFNSTLLINFTLSHKMVVGGGNISHDLILSYDWASCSVAGQQLCTLPSPCGSQLANKTTHEHHTDPLLKRF